jgi:hypothetical protein
MNQKATSGCRLVSFDFIFPELAKVYASPTVILVGHGLTFLERKQPNEDTAEKPNGTADHHADKAKEKGHQNLFHGLNLPTFLCPCKCAGFFRGIKP